MIDISSVDMNLIINNWFAILSIVTAPALFLAIVSRITNFIIGLISGNPRVKL